MSFAPTQNKLARNFLRIFSTLHAHANIHTHARPSYICLGTNPRAYVHVIYRHQKPPPPSAPTRRPTAAAAVAPNPTALFYRVEYNTINVTAAPLAASSGGAAVRDHRGNPSPSTYARVHLLKITLKSRVRGTFRLAARAGTRH